MSSFFSTTRLFPLALMLTLALLTLWLDRAVREEEPHPSLRRHDPDYVVDNFVSTSYARNGSAEMVLSAEKMLHYPDDNSLALLAPQVVQSKPGEPRFRVNADRGELKREGDEIFLYDNVLLRREAEEQRPEARMTTSFLHVVRDRGLVLTDREVLIVEGPRSLSGRGMEHNNLTRELVLHHDVQARIEPSAPR
jgi:lipopolysaccharide export system protein LptC